MITKRPGNRLMTDEEVKAFRQAQLDVEAKRFGELLSRRGKLAEQKRRFEELLAKAPLADQ